MALSLFINYGKKSILQKSELHPLVGIISHLQQWAYPTQRVKTENKITTAFILTYRCQNDPNRFICYCFKYSRHPYNWLFLGKIVKSLYVSGLIDFFWKILPWFITILKQINHCHHYRSLKENWKVKGMTKIF